MGKSRVTVLSMLRSRLIPSVRHGRRYIITKRAFERFLETCGTQQERVN